MPSFVSLRDRALLAIFNAMKNNLLRPLASVSSVVDAVLRSVIPPSVTNEVPSSFESVGHIAHVNLRENVLPWKYVVGRVILDKVRVVAACC